MACVRRGGGGGADGIAAVWNCWKQISSKVICYSDRAGNIFSQSERTNNQAGKTNGRQQGKWGKEKAREQGKKEWVSERERAMGEWNLRVNQNHLDVADLLLLCLEQSVYIALHMHTCITTHPSWSYAHTHTCARTHTYGSKYVQLLLKKLKILLTYEKSSHVCCNKRTAKWTTS